MALKNIILKLLPSLKKKDTYNYALYLGESGWGNRDLLILLATKGNVKFIGDAHKYNFDSNGLIEAHGITHWMHLSPPPIITSSKKGGEE